MITKFDTKPSHFKWDGFCYASGRGFVSTPCRTYGVQPGPGRTSRSGGSPVNSFTAICPLGEASNATFSVISSSILSVEFSGAESTFSLSDGAFVGSVVLTGAPSRYQATHVLSARSIFLPLNAA